MSFTRKLGAFDRSALLPSFLERNFFAGKDCLECILGKVVFLVAEAAAVTQDPVTINDDGGRCPASSKDIGRSATGIQRDGKRESILGSKSCHAWG